MITVFSTQWFAKYNHIITNVSRSIFGEFVFNFHKFGHYVDRKKIIAVRPNSVVEYVGYKEGRIEVKEHFFGRNEYALRLQSVFYPIWITFHIWDIITRPFSQLNLGFDTLEVNPDVSSGSTTVDGYARRTSVNENFATIIVGDGNSSSVADASIGMTLSASATSDQFSRLVRLLFTFDTSSLTSDAIISSVVFSTYGNQKVNQIGSPDYHVCSSTPAANNNLANSDYGQLGSTSFGNVSYASFNDAGYNDITLNASGIAAVSKTGITGLGSRLSWDINGSFTGTWSSNLQSFFNITFADNGTNKPKLVVTYTLPATGGSTPSTLLTMGVG